MLIKVQAINRATNFLVFQHALCSVAKRHNSNPVTTDGNTCCQVIHLCISYLWSNITMCPSIQDTSTIDTQQHTKTGLFCRMVNMCKGIHTTLRVIIHIAQNTINHSTGSSCCSNFTRIQYIQRQCIVRLIASSICNWCTCL